MKPKKRQPGEVPPGKANYLVEWWPNFPNSEWYHSKATAQRRLGKLRKAGMNAFIYTLYEE